MTSRLAILTALLVASPCAAQEAPDLPTVSIVAPAPFTQLKEPGCIEIVFTTNAAAQLEDGSWHIAVFANAITALEPLTKVAPVELCLEYGDHEVTLQLQTTEGVPFPNAQSIDTVPIRVSKPCTDTPECAIPDVCSSVICLPKGDGTSACTYGASPFPKCCDHVFDCAYGQQCELETNTCVACLEDAHCDDGKPCTVDVCTPELTCGTQPDPIEGCCDCSLTTAFPPVSIPEQCGEDDNCHTINCDCETNLCVVTDLCIDEGPELVEPVPEAPDGPPETVETVEAPPEDDPVVVEETPDTGPEPTPMPEPPPIDHDVAPATFDIISGAGPTAEEGGCASTPRPERTPLALLAAVALLLAILRLAPHKPHV